MNFKEKLHTERLILRQFSLSDDEAVFSWAKNPENVRFMSFEPHSLITETRNFIANTKLGKDFLITLENSGEVIGSCGIYPNDKNAASIGWLLHKDYWGQGYGTEVCKALLSYGFNDLKLRRIYAYCVATNHGSYKIMERNGMRREALFLKSHWSKVDKEWVDDAAYGILAEEYYGG